MILLQVEEMIFLGLLMLLKWEYIFAVVFIWVVYKLVSWMQNPLRKIPGPKGSMILGNTGEMAKPNDALRNLVKWKEQYGDVFKIWSIIGN